MTKACPSNPKVRSAMWIPNIAAPVGPSSHMYTFITSTIDGIPASV